MRNANARVPESAEICTCSGDTFHITFSSKLMPDGSIRLVESGRVDICESINSYKDSCDMSFILNRLAVGDTSVLEQSVPSYGNFLDMPKTLSEAMQLVIDGESKFNALPPEVKLQFDNDFRKWFASAGTGEWIDKMGSVIIKDTSISGSAIDKVVDAIVDPIKDKEVIE